MKTKKIHQILILVSLILSINNFHVDGQVTVPTNSITTPGNYVGTDATSTTYPDLSFQTLGTQQMFLENTTGNLGIGTGFVTPSQLVSIFGGNYNIDASSAYNGYMIADHFVVRTYNNPYDIYLGVDAAGNAGSNPSGSYNTIVGGDAGYALGTSTAAPYELTFLGYEAGYSNSSGIDNTLLGAYAGYHTNGTGPNGSYNTMTGINCGYWNSTGKANSYYGKYVAYNNNGNFNCMYGGHSGNGNSNNITVDSNSYFGTYSGQNSDYGEDNILIGMDAGMATGYNNTNLNNDNVFIGGNSEYLGPNANLSGTYNVTLGFRSNAFTGTFSSPGTINNSCALGAYTFVNQDNSIILGNDNQWTGIGLSYNPSLTGAIGYPGNSLEICARTQGTGAIIPNWSGLRFTNLTSSSPFSASPPGCLSLNASGDVIWISGIPATIGTCSSPTLLGGSSGIDMNNAGNFYFEGNFSGSTVNNVAIGFACAMPRAKLDVLQNSTSFSTVGILGENLDLATGTLAHHTNPSIGIKGYLPYPSFTASYYYNVAGWFEADEPGLTTIKGVFTPLHPTYAIFVPQAGGSVDIGYQYAIDNPTFLLKVNGAINTPSMTYPSDTILKKNVIPFNYGLKAIRKLNPVTYQYNGMGGFDTAHTYIGLIAENLARNVPDAVVPSLITKDTITGDTTTIENICLEGVLYTAVNAIKQLDSIVSKHDSNAWHTTGNTGITSANFLGAIDSANLVFKANNIKSGLIDLSHKNTAFGQRALYSVADTNAGGYYNVATGAGALARNINGNSNTATGTLSLYNNVADSNTANGDSSLYYVNQGSGNSALGYKAGLSHANTQGDDNTFLGDMTDVNPPPGSSVNGSTAVGAKSVVAASNQLELGNNNVTTSLGLSGYAPGQGPVRLEVNTQHGASPFTVASGSIPPAYINGGAGTGWSGVRFDDLTSGDLPAPNPGRGVLALDQAGDIIYVNASQSSSFSPSPCPLLNSIPLGGIGYVFNPNSNFYFNGNNSGNVGDESVIIGNGCSHLPLAKLDVLQNTGSGQPSIGLYVENDDRVCSTQPLAVIGIKSYLPAAPESGSVNQIAGWFEADNATNCCNSLGQYALYVPQYGGTVSIGWPYASNTCSPGWMLTVNGTCNNFGGYFHGSDSTVKTNIHPLTNAMSVINRLQGVSYNFVPAVINDSAMGGLHYGMLAQAVKRVIPGAVRRMNYNNSGSLLSLSYDDIVPWLVEGIKQQQLQISADSSLIQNLTNTLNSYIHCLDSLCRSSHAPIQGNGNGGNGNSTGNVNPNNSQDVTLAGTKDEAILYQNSPNPFTSGTTINYYLPVNIQGAKMLFFDSYGSQLKSVDLTQTGNGTLNVSADNLAAGIYTYSLVVDNKVIDTKRMILQK